jgi:prepilin-type N-terminal cleavage/methylation domain-containing protein
MSRSARVGFTLVELLVVVTIIVVLLALLLPAMGQAVYQATLTKCSAQMKGIAHGATSYAMNNKRTYMNRMVYRSASFPYGLKAPAAFAGTEGAAAVDDRPIHKGYIEMKALIDPLSETVDLELDSDPNEAIYANYVLYYGFGYRGQTPMQRIGDRWTFTDRKVNPSVSYEFSWLVADLDIIFEGLHASAGHPDKAKRMYPAYAQAGSFEYASQQ